MASVKVHLCNHIAWFWYVFPNPKSNDTNEGEGGHKGDKVLYQRSSRRYAEGLEEICGLITKKITSHALYRRVQAEETTTEVEVNDRDIEYSPVDNIYHNRIGFDNRFKQWTCDDSKGKKFIHPTLTMGLITDLLIGFASNNINDQQLVAKMTNPDDNNLVLLP
jgi:hypothetical protein